MTPSAPQRTSRTGVVGLRELAGTGVTSPAPNAFALSVHARVFENVRIERVAGRAFEYVHPVSTSVLDFVAIETGQAILHAGRAHVVERGQIAVLPAWSKHSVAVQSNVTFVRARFERSALEQIVPSMPDAPLVMRERPGLMTATMAFITEALSANRAFSAIESYATGQLLLEMAAGLLLARFGLGTPDASAAGNLRDRAIAVIAQRRTDPNLSIDDIAADVSVSPRRLQAAFAEASMTVSGELRRQRTQLAIDLLSSSRYSVLSVAEISSQCGFGSTLSLRRALRELHGTTPSALRKRTSTPRT